MSGQLLETALPAIPAGLELQVAFSINRSTDFLAAGYGPERRQVAATAQLRNTLNGRRGLTQVSAGARQRSPITLQEIVCVGDSRPRSRVIPCMAAMTFSMCVSKGNSSSWAPCSMSSRLTAAANDFCFIFLRTLLAVIPASFYGRTYATAVTKPQSSSTANKVFRSGRSKGYWSQFQVA
jgi:hypothetical protein